MKVSITALALALVASAVAAPADTKTTTSDADIQKLREDMSVLCDVAGKSSKECKELAHGCNKELVESSQGAKDRLKSIAACVANRLGNDVRANFEAELPTLCQDAEKSEKECEELTKSCTGKDLVSHIVCVRKKFDNLANGKKPLEDKHQIAMDIELGKGCKSSLKVLEDIGYDRSADDYENRANLDAAVERCASETARKHNIKPDKENSTENGEKSSSSQESSAFQHGSSTQGVDVLTH
ncbi:hypothetical protein O9K51_04018 [Purpureocillium lavendulum]|uniref:Uncharacterized protein n=1 Tax=Purpureocillium lavendulum TaxID=1247861 RepID=A0AB34FTL3_9HYPO|nr:hypothetical protein O9K51_04018 [Purpureocillium lavendulum]